MICLTVDVHHSSLNTGNQQHCDISELQCAHAFFARTREANVKTTCFITGKCFEQELADVRVICDDQWVEVGGHTYSGFTPQWWHRVSNKVFSSYNGPRWYQHWDVAKTLTLIKHFGGRDAQCWRNHMYMHGPFTEQILAKNAIRVCSDGVKRNSTGPQLHSSGIYNFPLNIIPDHEHLYHAERTPQWVEKWQKRYRWSDDFGSKSYYIDEWTDMVLTQLQQREQAGVLANLIIHPITMYLCDGFKSFERILDYISRRETFWMTECLPETSELRKESIL